ncbi:OPT superfamily oligopeptide transporter [Pseudovirgaria hyperparasitica]|uniref:OPT superfamily oligopeptide transporter n=1 Tax=Pseudovirgaria hyperparasitica TaxID=470096 RepID=A0A6A6W9S8_9PEZI|nr:OPT superfamily oligopeptide transporter [Pseudovirgaria hyperparasitica]KAF2758784.1 OPT superfamily oligopeptide transporter [Pseudovirgaria hyperparasitica]
MVFVGTLLGTLVCIANMYFGLQVGTLSTMNTSTALLSFAIFKSALQWTDLAFSPTENVVIQTIASSIAGMPVTASLTSIIPAFESLRRPEEGGSYVFSVLDLMLWSLGVALFGTVFAAPFRSLFILQEKLRFPGGYATGVLVGVLHKDDQIIRRTEEDKSNVDIVQQMHSHVRTTEATEEWPVNSTGGRSFEWKSKVMIVSKTFLGTGIYVIASYFVPNLSRIPIFGTTASRDWLWYLTLSPAFTAFGMVLDPHIAIAMMLGAVIGWGILAPVANHKGWAPGPVESMEDGARGWLIWISVGLLLGDALVRVVHPIIRYAHSLFGTVLDICKQNDNHDTSLRQPLLGPRGTSVENLDSSDSCPSVGAVHSPNSENELVSHRALIVWLSISTFLCIACTLLVYGSEIPIYLVVTSIAISFPLCLVVIRSVGETDMAPSMSLSNVCQFLFVLMLAGAARNRLITMVAAGITEAGLWQSAVLMTDLKTAYLVQASPKVMFYAQLLGSFIGVFVGSGIYRLFRAAYTFPSAAFPVPLAHLWANTARLANGGSLPNGAWPVMIGALVLSALLRILNLVGGSAKWTLWVPSGVAMSIGMYVTPSITLARLAGAGIRLWSLKYMDISEVSLMSAATGCILGEGILGFIPAILTAAGVPKLW